MFRRMWATEAWAPMRPPRAKRGHVGGKPCWESVRDDASVPQSSDTFFNETLEGLHCDTNWYLGNPGTLGSVSGGPNFAEAR